MDRGGVAGTVADLATRTGEQTLLEAVVAACRDLAGATYAAALLLGPDGNPCGLAHTGMTREQVSVLPHLPRPVGLIGQVLAGRTLHLTRMGDHPAAVGFPSGHVPMAAMLGVPVTVDGRVLGGLYLTRRPDEAVFDDEDLAVAVALATQTGATVTALRDQAASERLVEALGLIRSREDEQVLDFTRPSPVVRRMLATARTVLGLDLTFLSAIADGTQTFTAVDAAPGAPDVPEGAAIDAADGFCQLMLDGTIPASVPDVRATAGVAALSAPAAIGVGAYCGVPVRLPDGTLYGTLCGLHGSATPPPSAAQLQAMGTIADLIGARIAAEMADAEVRQRERDSLTELTRGRRSRIVVQPIVELAGGRPRGWEALSRFTERTGAPRRPDRVFAEAARLGLGTGFELSAAGAALDLLPLLPDGTYLSVNLSPATVCDPATYDLLNSRPLDRVVLELTEHERIAEYEAVTDALAGLRARGLRLAVDDAGSGFAGLQHLALLRPDIIKLDIAFVRDIHLDPARRAVARAVIGYAAETGAHLVAEGIETPTELAVLRGLGAEFGQGYLLGRPGDPDEVFAAARAGAPVPAGLSAGAG